MRNTSAMSAGTQMTGLSPGLTASYRRPCRFRRRRDGHHLCGEALEELIGELMSGGFDQPRADLCQLAADDGIDLVAQPGPAAVCRQQPDEGASRGETGGAALSLPGQPVAIRRVALADRHPPLEDRVSIGPMRTRTSAPSLRLPAMRACRSPVCYALRLQRRSGLPTPFPGVRRGVVPRTSSWGSASAAGKAAEALRRSNIRDNGGTATSRYGLLYKRVRPCVRSNGATLRQPDLKSMEITPEIVDARGSPPRSDRPQLALSPSRAREYGRFSLGRGFDRRSRLLRQEFLECGDRPTLLNPHCRRWHEPKGRIKNADNR